MKPIRDIIVRVDRAYKDKIELKGGIVLFTHNAIKQVHNTVRYGIVEYLPDECVLDVEIGDTVFFHHNIVGITTMDDGKEDIESSFLVDKKESLYMVPIDLNWPMIYARIRNGVFEVLDGCCFVRKHTEKQYETELYIHNNEKETENIGEMVYPDKRLINTGINKGDLVIFEKDSEYQFELDGETLYCMLSKWILAKV